ncbi:RING finger protein [Dirofilaria immitis]
MASKTNDSSTNTSHRSSGKRSIPSCVICSEAIVLGDVSTLLCGHYFHYMCIMNFFLYGWTSCPECHKPADMMDILPQSCFVGKPEGNSDAQKLANYRGVLRKLHKAYTSIATLEKNEVNLTMKELKLTKEHRKLKRKNKELRRENKTLRSILVSIKL